jgi:3-oxoacyl-[acyl-carrier protein] reductase
VNEGRVGVVTGASGALGTAIARSLAESGFSLMLHYHRNRTGAEMLAADLGVGRSVKACGVDLGRPGGGTVLVHKAIAEFGRVDVLINNAGRKVDAPLDRLPDEAWDAVLQTNLTAAMNTSRAALPGMYERGWGRIVNITSIGAQTGYPGTAAYAASKAGVIGLTRVVAAEGARQGVTCNAIAPGLVDAGMGAELPPRAYAAMIAATPAGRAASPSEIGQLSAFLVSAAGGFITGQVYSVNGGLYM